MPHRRRQSSLHNCFAALAVGLLDRLLDLRDGFFARQHAADGKEAGLHDGVDARAHPGFARDRVAVDHIELDLLASAYPAACAAAGGPRLPRPSKAS